MASITKNKGNGKNKVMMSDEELNTVTIAIALLNIEDLEIEIDEQKISKNDVVYDHLTLFDPFAKATKLYSYAMKDEQESEQGEYL